MTEWGTPLAEGMEMLDAFLCSDDAPPECMQLCDLDGFLTGIAIGPELVMPSEWMPVIWGGEEPEFTSGEQAQAVIGAIMGRYNAILNQIEDGSFDPIFWMDTDDVPIAIDWAEGFSLAIGLRSQAWGPLFKSRRHTPFLVPILGLCKDEGGESVLGLDSEAIDRLMREAPDLIPGCVAEIARFWRAHRTVGASRATPKVGRNDPCPCGSSKKYKKCCGLNA